MLVQAAATLTVFLLPYQSDPISVASLTHLHLHFHFALPFACLHLGRVTPCCRSRAAHGCCCLLLPSVCFPRKVLSLLHPTLLESKVSSCKKLSGLSRYSYTAAYSLSQLVSTPAPSLPHTLSTLWQSRDLLQLTFISTGPPLAYKR